MAEQYLVSCDGDDDGCSGGLFFKAFPYLVNKSGLSGGIGTVDEVSFPYVASKVPCTNLSGFPRYTAYSWNYANTSTGLIHPEFAIPSEAEIKSAIASKGPVAVGIYVTDNFFNYTAGIFEDHGTYDYTDHAVILVGWGEAMGKKYYIGKNSWGTGWGEDGWFRIETNSCRIGEGTCFFDNPVFSRPVITGVYPPSGLQNSTLPVVNITGDHFSMTDRVELNRTGGETRILDANLSGINLTVHNLSLIGFTPGFYTVSVTNTTFGISGMKEAAFQVLPDGPTPDPRIHGITATSAGPGYIMPSGTILAAHGTNQTIQIRSKPGAIINELRVDGGQISLPYGTSQYAHSFMNITANHTITATHQVMDKVLIAGFDVNITGGQVPLTVKCTDTTQGIPDQWYWTFGDGSSAIGQSPEHTYTRAGAYDIKLWVRNAHASSSVVREAVITVTDAP
jgi:PKD repeat protein